MYNLKIIKSGDRLEIYKINNYLIRKKADTELPDPLQNSLKLIDKELRKERNKDPTESNKNNRKRSLRDARNNIIRLIKANDDMTTFITLTFAKESDYKESKKYLNNFFTKLRKVYNNLKYIWNLEYGEKNQRLHYHILCNIPINIKLSDSKEKKSDKHKALENYFEKHYWKHGIVDIRELNQEDNTNIALYVSTYIIKSFQDKNLEGYRIYGYSHKTLNKPIVTTCYTRDSVEEILIKFEDYKINYCSSYEIGYSDYKGDHKGQVNYFDLEVKK